MIYKKKRDFFLWIFLIFFNLSCVTGVTTRTSTTTSNSTTPATDAITESSNNALWLIIGVVCGVILVGGVVLTAGIAYAVHRSKRIHPHSDTESFYTESESPSQSRPTTASHIMLEPEEEEAMSRPVTMTPFELRKLYIETFPYRNWRRGFDGSLRPKMSLRFVDPRIYSAAKGEERQFRDKIYNYEMSDSLTLRSSALSRMMQHAKLPTMEEMDSLPEGHVSPIDHGVQIDEGQGEQSRQENHAESPRNEFESVCMRSGDVELM